MSIQLVEIAVGEVIREVMANYGISESMLNEGYYGHLTSQEVGVIGSEIKKIIKRIYYEFGYEVDGYRGEMNTIDEIRKYWEDWDKYS